MKNSIKNLKLKMKENKAITLIALVITIVVLIILAGVLISLTLGNNGLFNKAKLGKEKYANAQDYEETEIAKVSNEIDTFTRAGGTGGSNYKRTLLYPANKSTYSPANVENTGSGDVEYTLNDSYTNYEYLLVECNYHSSSGNYWVGTVLNPIITEDIIQTDTFLKNTTEHPNTSFSAFVATGYIGWYFPSNTTFRIGEKDKAEITRIYGINF